MKLDSNTLFAANIIILTVMALTFAVAGWRRSGEPWWRSWMVAKLVMVLALGCYVVERSMPPFLVALLPNGLLVLGFALRWRAARQFGERAAPLALVWGSFALFAVGVVPFAGVSYAPVFVLTNILLTALALAVVWEFWRDRADGMPSRYGLIAAYALIAGSFGWRAFAGILQASTMPDHLPQDTALVVHLIIALVHTVASGAFALSIAYERGNAKLHHAAMHDALTGLPNRSAFEARFQATLAEAAQGRHAVAMLDIDHFKLVNDRFGHAAGDAALRECAKVCTATLGPRGMVARIGGEEFALLLEAADDQEALELVQEIRRAVGSTRITCGPVEFRVTLSGGVLHLGANVAEYDTVMRRVDAALYQAKVKGRNQIHKIAA